MPIQAVNLSLEEVKLQKRTYVGEASPISNKDVVQKDVEINRVLKEPKVEPRKFEYLQEKLAHLKIAERRTLEPVLRKYKHLFYGLGSTQDVLARQNIVLRQGMQNPLNGVPTRFLIHSNQWWTNILTTCYRKKL